MQATVKAKAKEIIHRVKGDEGSSRVKRRQSFIANGENPTSTMNANDTSGPSQHTKTRAGPGNGLEETTARGDTMLEDDKGTDQPASSTTADSADRDLFPTTTSGKPEHQPQDTHNDKNANDNSGRRGGVGDSAPPGDDSDPIEVDIDGKTIKIRSQIQLYCTNAQLDHPYVSPALGNLAGLPPMFIMGSSGELLRDEIIYTAHKAANPSKYPIREGVKDTLPSLRDENLLNLPPTKVHLQIYDGTCHDLPLFAFTEPAKHSFRAVAQWCKYVTDRQQQVDLEENSRQGTQDGRGSVPGLHALGSASGRSSRQSSMRGATRSKTTLDAPSASKTTLKKSPLGASDPVVRETQHDVANSAPATLLIPSRPDTAAVDHLSSGRELPPPIVTDSDGLLKSSPVEMLKSAEARDTMTSSPIEMTRSEARDTMSSSPVEMSRESEKPADGDASTKTHTKSKKTTRSLQHNTTDNESDSMSGGGLEQWAKLRQKWAISDSRAASQDRMVNEAPDVSDTQGDNLKIPKHIPKGHAGNPEVYDAPDGNPFTDHGMIRQRVSREGVCRPMESPDEIPELSIPPEEIGIIKKGPAERYLKGQQLWTEKYKKFAKQADKQRQRNIKRALKDSPRIEKAFEDSFKESGDQKYVLNKEFSWSWALDGERPPPSAVVGRRDTVSLRDTRAPTCSRQSLILCN